jgi:hypothetical protein
VLAGSTWRKAIIVDRETDKFAIVILLGITFAATIVAGVALGLATKRAELGIAASAGLFALISAFEVLLLWMVD